MLKQILTTQVKCDLFFLPERTPKASYLNIRHLFTMFMESEKWSVYAFILENHCKAATTAATDDILDHYTTRRLN